MGQPLTPSCTAGEGAQGVVGTQLPNQCSSSSSRASQVVAGRVPLTLPAPLLKPQDDPNSHPRPRHHSSSRDRSTARGCHSLAGQGHQPAQPHGAALHPQTVGSWGWQSWACWSHCWAPGRGGDPPWPQSVPARSAQHGRQEMLQQGWSCHAEHGERGCALGMWHSWMGVTFSIPCYSPLSHPRGATGHPAPPEAGSGCPRERREEKAAASPAAQLH